MTDDESKVKSHPSYGMVRVGRVQGGHTRLFGSSITTHPGYIHLSVSPGKSEHQHGQDWFYAEGKDLIEIRMSYAQFAEMIVSLNHGNGTPCTITRYNGEMIDPPPNEPIEAEKTKLSFKKKCKDLDDSLTEKYDIIKELMAKKNLTKKDRGEVLRHLFKISQEIRANMPFLLEQFEEATERVTTVAKAEVDGFMTAALQAAGMEAIASGSFTGLLPEKKEDYDD